MGQSSPLIEENRVLKSEIDRLDSSSEKVDLLLKLAVNYEHINLDSAFILNEEAFEMAQKIDYKNGIIRYASNQSFLYNLLGDFSKGLEINQMAYQTALDMDDPATLLSTIANIGISYSYLNNYEEAIANYMQALDMAIDIRDELREARLYGVIAGTYNNMGKSQLLDSLIFEKSIDYGHKALNAARKINDSILISDGLNNLSLAYMNLERHDEAYPHVLESKTISKQIGLNSIYAQNLSIMAEISRKRGLYDDAIRMAGEAVALNTELGSTMGIVINLKELALCYFYQGNPEKALVSIEKAIDLAEKQEMIYILDGMYINKGDYLYHLSQYKEAYEFLLKGQTLADSLRGYEIKARIQELEKKYETAKKEQEILSLTTRQKVNNFIITGLILALISALIISLVVFKNIKYKNKIIQQEKDQIKSQQKIDATASIIQGQEEERRRLARDLHDGLGGILSGIKYNLNHMGENMIITGKSVEGFNNALTMLDQAISEMRKVAHNMMPESLLKFGLDETLKDFVYKINSSQPMQVHYQSYNYERMDQSIEINLYRIIQEGINNAIKHAKATDMYIQVDYEKDHIHLTMEDNGIGFDMNLIQQKEGIGLKNIKDRVSYMNGSIEINSMPERGTHFVIEIKKPVL